MQKRRCRQRRSWCTYAWTGPLRLALAGATRSGTAGVEYLIAIHGYYIPYIPRRLDPSHIQTFDFHQTSFQPRSNRTDGNRMIDTIIAFLISLGIIGVGLAWIVAGMNSATAAFWIGIGIASIAVGVISVLNELRN